MINVIKIDKDSAVELARKMSIPSYSNGVEFVTLDRLNAAEEEIRDSKYCHFVDGKIFRLYSQKKIEDIKGKILLISSHADCLQEKPVFERASKDHQKRMIGIFDNSITNAACLYLMKYCDLPENVVFAFTGDEESSDETRTILGKIGLDYQKTNSFLKKFRNDEGLDYDDEVDMMGAYSVCKFLKEKNKNFNTIVLDCTYSAFDDNADFTLENDFIYNKDIDWLNRILQCFSNIDMKWKFIPADENQKEENIDEYVKSKYIIDKISVEQMCYDEGEIEKAWDDESYEYDARDISCISLCLPCDADDMHSNKGFGIRRKNYYNYIKILYLLCKIEV